MGERTREPMTRLERVAGWSLWLTVWGPIITILLSFQQDVEYSYYIGYRNLIFPALLLQKLAYDSHTRRTQICGRRYS